MDNSTHVIEKIQIDLFNSSDNELVIVHARNLAAKSGFPKATQFLIASAASELATNIIRYAGKGEVMISVIKQGHQTGLKIVAIDNGPGIADIDKAMEEKFTTAPKSLGMGLPSVKRIMDDFHIQSEPEKGTEIVAVKWHIKD